MTWPWVSRLVWLALAWLLVACTEEKSLDLNSQFRLDAGSRGDGLDAGTEPDTSHRDDVRAALDAGGDPDTALGDADEPVADPDGGSSLDAAVDAESRADVGFDGDVSGDAGDREDTGDAGDAEPGEVVRFVVFGDWGIYLISRIHEAADAMHAFCQDRGCDFVVGTGDNFYETGVTGLDDEQFRIKFEEPFADWDIPFYMTLGNHDYGGNVAAQVAYTDESDTWTLPARWYEVQAGPVHLAALDTNRITAAQANGHLEGLRASELPWRIGFGHHPMRSNGAHGDTGGGRRDLLEWILCDVADVYLAGHDHNLEHLDPTCGVDLVVSGAVTTTRDVAAGENTRFISNQRGFTWLEVSETHLRLEMWDLEGNLLYSWDREASDRQPSCTADDHCEPECADDPDCVGLDCAGDGSCDDRCPFDPDCFRNCPCDYNAGICEPTENPSLISCGCDPACRGGRSPCVDDGHCDSWCPVGTDPDCTE